MMTKQEQLLKEVIQEAVAPLANRIDDLNREVRALHQAIASNYEPLISPAEACRILGIGRDALKTLCRGDDAPLQECIHWKWKNPAVQQKRRTFFRDVVLDYSIRGETDPIGHERFCIEFHNRKKSA